MIVFPLKTFTYPNSSITSEKAKAHSYSVSLSLPSTNFLIFVFFLHLFSWSFYLRRFPFSLFFFLLTLKTEMVTLFLIFFRSKWELEEKEEPFLRSRKPPKVIKVNLKRSSIFPLSLLFPSASSVKVFMNSINFIL